MKESKSNDNNKQVINMKIMIAPDSFKGSLTAGEVAENIEKGIKRIFPEALIIKIPMADGGEGTVQSLVDATGGEIIKKKVTGPLGDEVEAEYGLLGEKDIAVIEMAAASGLPLLSENEADPSLTTTYGTGELIKTALDQGVSKIIVGIGGSATNDAGTGMAQALGVRFIKENGDEAGWGGKELEKIKEIDLTELDPRIKDVEIEVACDVDNPLYGPQGAAFVYAPQKGANEEMVQKLDKNLRHFSEIIEKELDKDVQSIPGSGAAGGLGAGLVAFLGAELRSGIKIVLEVNKVKEKMSGVDLVFTGEGQVDEQSINGKTPVGIARTAEEFEVPVIVLGGSLGKGVNKVFQENINAVFSIIQRPSNLKEVFKNTADWLQFSAEQICRIVNIDF